MFRRSLRAARSRSRKSPSSRVTRFHPTFEPLEQRTLLSINMAQWSTQDIVFTTTNTSSNWYTDSRYLQATFTPPAGSGLSNIVAKGFWDGGSTFKVRFTPTTTGTWTYTTTGSTVTGLTNTTDGTGQIVVSAAVSGEHGFLRVDPSHTGSFIWDDGTRYFMWGQSYYNEMDLAAGGYDWKSAIDASAAYGINKLRFEVYPYTVPTTPNGTAEFSIYPDFQPYTGTSTSPNRDSLNLSFWTKLDEVVQYLDSKGMVADLIVTTGYSNNRQFGTDTQNDRFINYVVNRYAAYDNVIWCLANEWAVASSGPNAQTQSDFNRMGGIIHSNDPWLSNSTALRPLSIHQNTGIDFQFFGTGWPTEAIIQYGFRNGAYNTGDGWGNAGIVYNLGHNMPVVNDEYGYIGEPSQNGGPAETRTVSRNIIWGIAAAGGYGSVGDFRIPPNNHGQPEVTGEWYDATQYADIQRLITFFTTKGIEYWKMTSHNELTTSGSRDYLLAEPGRQYVLYTAAGDSAAKINLSGYSGNFNVVKFDPTNGAMTNLGPVAGGATRTWNLTGTNSAGGADWVLLVTALDVPGVLPAVPASLAATVISTSRIDLAWTDRSSSETGFEIDRATNSTFTSGLTTVTVGANVTTYQSTGLTSGTKYYYRVRTTIGGTTDSANSNTASATAGALPPAAPTGLVAAAASSSQINLSWTDHSTNETGFEIDRALNSTFTSGLTTVTVTSNVTTFQSTGLNSGTTYYYRVRSTIGGTNDSTNSNTANAATFVPVVQLLSDYTFDTSNGGQIASGAPTGGTVVGSAFSGAAGSALIGAGGLSLASYQSYFNEASGSRPNATDGGAVTGTESIWIKIKKSGTINDPMLWVASDGSDTINHGAYVDFSTGKIYWYTKNNRSNSWVMFSATASGWNDNGAAWHLLTVTYSIAAGGASTAQFYLDGNALATTKTNDNLASTTNIGAFNEWGVSRDHSGNAPWGSQGSMDDFAVWGTRLSATQVKALYNLGIAGVAGTKYNGVDASALYDAFAYGVGATTSDGRNWYYVTSGLVGAVGAVGSNYVVLNSSGAGMKFGVPVDVTWTGVGGSTWSTVGGSGNWKNTSDATSADYFNGVNVLFNDTATSTSVFIDGADVTPSTITFNNTSKNYTVTGAKGIAGATTTVTKQGAGTVTINTSNTYGGMTTVEAGKLVLQDIVQAMAPVLTGAGADIKGGMLVLDYSGEASPAATVNTLINNGKIHSSVADTTQGLGWIDNTTTNTISIAYTVYGDTNLDGSVNFTDLSKLLSNYGHAGVWADGDFNYDGMIDFADLSKLLSTYNQSIGLLIPAASPSSIVDLSAPQVAGDDGSATIVPAAPVTTAAPVEDSLPSRRPVAIRQAAAIRPAAVDRIDLFALAAYELTRRYEDHVPVSSDNDQTDDVWNFQVIR